MSVPRAVGDRMRRTVRRLRRVPVNAAGRPGVLTVLVLAAGAWTFIEVGDEVAEGETARFDTWVFGLLWHGPATSPDARPAGPDWLVTAALDLTSLGSAAVLVLVVLLTAVFLALRRRRGAMLLVLVSIALGQLVNSGLKAWFGRERPEAHLHLVEVSTASFPSGHAMMSAVTYLTLGALLASVENLKRIKAFALAAAALLTVLVGLTRVYLGVHHASDVLAGWAAGLAWASASWLAAQWLRRRGALRRPGDA